MTMRKILAVVLCVCAVLSVMAVVAYSANLPGDEEAGFQAFDTTAPTTVPTTTAKPMGDQIAETWEKIKPYIDMIYQFLFQGFSKTLVAGFQWLIAAAGLNFWEGGLFGFLT